MARLLPRDHDLADIAFFVVNDQLTSAEFCAAEQLNSLKLPRAKKSVEKSADKKCSSSRLNP